MIRIVVTHSVRRALWRKTERPQPHLPDDHALALQRIRDMAKAEELFGHCTDPKCTAKQALKGIETLLATWHD